MSAPELLRHLELEGFVVLPGILDTPQRRRMKDELVDIPMQPAWYSSAPTWGSIQPQWHSRSCAELIGNPPLVDFLEALLGPDVVFVHGHFLRKSSGGGGSMPLITNSQPLGSALYGWRNSSPIMVRTLTYLDDSGGVFRVVPRSHLSFHSDANPYLRYLSHPAEIHVRPSAGDILLFAGSVFHGGGESSSAAAQDNGQREVIEMTYRPLWARPASPVEEWEPEHLEKIPVQARRFLISRNAGVERSASRTGG
jgi:hypothetical protein